MNRYNIKFFTIALSALFCSMNGMEDQQQLSMVEQKATERALSTLEFVKDEKVLHVGSYPVGKHCVDIIKEKNLGSRIRFVRCINANKLNMMEKCEDKYEKVLTFACWDVVKNPQEMFNDSVSLLKLGGQLCAVVPRSYSKSPYLRIHHKTFMSDKWRNFYDKDKEVTVHGSRRTTNMLRAAGLMAIACEIIKEPFIFETREKFMEWVASYSDELNGIIPQEQHAEFIEDVVNNYLKEYPLTEENSVRLHLPYMIISGHKLL